MASCDIAVQVTWLSVAPPEAGKTPWTTIYSEWFNPSLWDLVLGPILRVLIHRPTSRRRCLIHMAPLCPVGPGAGPSPLCQAGLRVVDLGLSSTQRPRPPLCWWQEGQQNDLEKVWPSDLEEDSGIASHAQHSLSQQVRWGPTP